MLVPAILSIGFLILVVGSVTFWWVSGERQSTSTKAVPKTDVKQGAQEGSTKAVSKTDANQGTQGAQEAEMVVKDYDLTNASVSQRKIQEESYYFFFAGIRSDASTPISFKRQSCTLIGTDGKRYTDCWICMVGWSAGTRVRHRGPMQMRQMEAIPGRKVDASMITGDAGEWSAEFSGQDGFVELAFLWLVADGFQPARLTIDSVVEISNPDSIDLLKPQN